MTDRYNALTVILEVDTRDDDAEALINAIRMIRGVASVQPHIASYEHHMAEERAKLDLRKRLWEALEGP
jgi:hypothetical protein